MSRPAARLASPPELPGPAVASRANAYGSRLLQRPSSPPRELDADPIDRRIEDMLFGSARPVNRTDCTDKARLSPETAAPAVTVEAQNEEVRKSQTRLPYRPRMESMADYLAAGEEQDHRHPALQSRQIQAVPPTIPRGLSYQRPPYQRASDRSRDKGLLGRTAGIRLWPTEAASLRARFRPAEALGSAQREGE